LPFLDRLTFIQVPDDNAQALRFQAGETDLVTRLTAEDFDLLAPGQQSGAYRLYDLGPGFEYNFLFFNLADLAGRNLPQVARRQAWFRERAFRQAVSALIDRDAIVRLIYRGRGTPLWTHVTPANRPWVNEAVPHKPRAPDTARQLLRAARFWWDSDGRLRDAAGELVQFSILVAAGYQPRTQMATIIQEDLAALGIKANVVSLEFRALLNRVLETRDYEACVLGLASGDADPSSEMNVWLSSGPTHLWNPGQARPSTPWEAEIDDLMRRQFVTMDATERKRLYDRVQAIVAEELPIIALASPHILVGVNAGLANFRPAILDQYVLSHVDELYWRRQRSESAR
jgi:peptide/nickel transport system substrate-binding protein